MSNLILFTLASIGLTNIMINSVIMAPLRCYLKTKLNAKVFEIFECYQCMGFWCGMVCGGLVLSEHWLAFVLLYGFACSFIANIMFDVHQLILASTYYERKE